MLETDCKHTFIMRLRRVPIGFSEPEIILHLRIVGRFKGGHSLKRIGSQTESNSLSQIHRPIRKYRLWCVEAESHQFLQLNQQGRMNSPFWCYQKGRPVSSILWRAKFSWLSKAVDGCFSFRRLRNSELYGAKEDREERWRTSPFISNLLNLALTSCVKSVDWLPVVKHHVCCQIKVRSGQDGLK